MITRRALVKWTILTVICGGQSLFWGWMTTHSLAAMLLGMTTLILLFATIESHPRYQAARGSDPRLARALDLGIRLRWIYAFAYPAILALDAILTLPKSIALLLGGDIWIGMGAIEVTKMLTGIAIFEDKNAKIAAGAMAINPHSLDYQFGVYFTTLITGLMHTLILALLCAIIYGILRLKRRRAA